MKGAVCRARGTRGVSMEPAWKWQEGARVTHGTSMTPGDSESDQKLNIDHNSNSRCKANGWGLVDRAGIAHRVFMVLETQERRSTCMDKKESGNTKIRSWPLVPRSAADGCPSTVNMANFYTADIDIPVPNTHRSLEPSEGYGGFTRRALENTSLDSHQRDEAWDTAGNPSDPHQHPFFSLVKEIHVVLARVLASHDLYDELYSNAIILIL
eukprot:1159805-Pelagomonas_calceolata.AAC.11